MNKRNLGRDDSGNISSIFVSSISQKLWISYGDNNNLSIVFFIKAFFASSELLLFFLKLYVMHLFHNNLSLIRQIY